MIAAALLLQAAAPAEAARDQAFNPPDRCWREEGEGRRKVIVGLGSRSCVRFSAARQFDGVWINAFEGQRFVEGARVQASVPRTLDDAIWFDTDAVTRWKNTEDCPRQHACRITFTGRAARDMHRKPLEGYGHFGMFAGMVLADEVLRIKDLGPYPPSSTSRD